MLHLFMSRVFGLSLASRPWGALALLLAVSTVLVGACSEDTPATVLQAIDTQKPTGQANPFDRNVIADPASFADVETLKPADVQRFLGKTPYERASFLETYQSNGIRAADSIMSAARQYRINPLVFLVFAQAAQGLVGERNYPFPPDRVEYVFRCGCLEAKSCLPQLAGFDRQVDCLGRALREAIDEIKLNETTKTGWGPNKTSLTLDNLKVTPDNEATAALYDRLPRVNEGGAGGTWLFWNLWNLYALKIDYAGPIGTIDGRWIGEPCVTDATCGVQNSICATDYPDGLCTVSCTSDCPSTPTKPETFCVKFESGGFCFPKCNPKSPQCRAGYSCIRVAGVGSGDSEYVCNPG
jgi:hypothetical protein